MYLACPGTTCTLAYVRHADSNPDYYICILLLFLAAHTCEEGEAARDVALNFVQRWNHHKVVNGEDAYPFLQPKQTEYGNLPFYVWAYAPLVLLH